MRRSVEAHEKLHSTLAQRALGAHTDPAKDAESSMAADRAVLKDRTNLYFTTAVSNLTTASSELKVKAEMRRISEFVPGGCIDFPAWDSAVRGGCYFLFASFADKGE